MLPTSQSSKRIKNGHASLKNDHASLKKIISTHKSGGKEPFPRPQVLLVEHSHHHSYKTRMGWKEGNITMTEIRSTGRKGLLCPPHGQEEPVETLLSNHSQTSLQIFPNNPIPDSWLRDLHRAFKANKKVKILQVLS